MGAFYHLLAMAPLGSGTNNSREYKETKCVCLLISIMSSLSSAEGEGNTCSWVRKVDSMRENGQLSLYTLRQGQPQESAEKGKIALWREPRSLQGPTNMIWSEE